MSELRDRKMALDSAQMRTDLDANGFDIVNERTPKATKSELFAETAARQAQDVVIAQQVASKQDTLESGRNIKTINGESILGPGNIEIRGGGGGAVDSVNGKTGEVELTASDISVPGAEPDSVTDMLSRQSGMISGHTANTNNPHKVTADQVGALAAEDMSGTKSVRDPVIFQNAVDVAEELTVGGKAVALRGESLSDGAKLDLSADITYENTPMNYAVMYATRNKLDGDAAAAAYATNRAYAPGDYVSYEGRVYKCTTTHAAGAWDPAHFTEEKLMDADASLVIDDVTGELKVTDAGGNVVWSSKTASMYDLVKTSSATPQANSVQFLEVTDGMTITIPTAPGGKACDFILDVHAEADATVEIANLTSVTVMVSDGVSLSADITTFAAGEYARLAFTACAFQVDGKPTYHVTKTKVVNGVTA